MCNWITNLCLFKKVKENNRGVATLEMVLLLVVLIAIVVIFKDQVTTLIESIFTKVTKEALKI